MRFHFEILTQHQQEALQLLGPIATKEGFYLLADMLGWYQEKFKIEELGHVLYSLVYFADAEVEPMPRMIWDVDWKQVKKALQEAAREVGS